MNRPDLLDDTPEILLAHGGGGKKTGDLIERLFRRAFDSPELRREHDGAVLDSPEDGSSLAVTTDSFVVTPLFFPGGNIGDLAVNGTVNDLAMCGADPRHLTAGFVIEEGFDTEKLWTIVSSMKRRADDVGAEVVTGDTKVVDRGTGDGVYINTTGLGHVPEETDIGPSRVAPGDRILVNGPIGSHGITILSEREELNLSGEMESDTSPVSDLVQTLLQKNVELHCLRDLTRGGLAAGTVEIAESRNLHIRLREHDLPVDDTVRGACELLGLDPEHIACEGRFVAFVPEEDAGRALEIMAGHPQAPAPAQIGTVTAEQKPLVSVEGPIGGARILELPGGEQLPRIC